MFQLSTLKIARVHECAWVSRYRATDGLIIIRSVKLSNHVAMAQLPEGVAMSYFTGAKRAWPE